MGTAAPAKRVEYPSMVAGRYRIERILGRGGMAVVFQARDTRTDRTLALKQLLPREDSRNCAEIARLFEREFYTLAQLAHPGVIEVYEFGKDDTQPYYTMELLDGDDLRVLAPLSWKQTCSLLVDVCSALGLLHSRKQVHRDVSPRNIYCTRNGKAKLIDFGAMVPVGPCKCVIGTAAYASPEAVGLQILDGQSDLYSLGATLYYTLTRQNAYPARTFADLRRLWGSKPLPPSHFVADIPRDLDDLVLSLMNVDPMARPANAAEVMEKLSAIAGLELDERMLVSQAHLSTPTLVGREEQLHVFGRQLKRALGGRGHAIIIESASGAGRSRFLNTCVLEGTVLGAVVLRADASDAFSGNWSAVRAIASQLLDALPAAALAAAEPHLAVLGHVLPELLSRHEAAGLGAFPAEDDTGQLAPTGGEEPADGPSAGPGDSRLPSRRPSGTRASGIPLHRFDDAQELRPRVQAALREWLLRIGTEHPLVLAIDDVHRLDEPSAAFVALLSREISQKKVLVAVTVDTGAAAGSPNAMELLKETCTKIRLRDLSLAQTEDLLGSIFGQTAHLRLVAARIQTISRGNPRAVMQLAQHLVDNKAIRYQAGTWLLPASIDAGDLPASLADALRARTQRLAADALRLAQTMASSPEHSFSRDECLLLTEHRQLDRLIQNLDELVAAEIVSADAEQYWLTQGGWVSVLTQDIDEPTRRGCHQRLAEMFERRGTELFRAAQHRLRAGEEERALEAFVAFSETSNRLTGRDPTAYSELLQSLPHDWQSTLSTAIGLARSKGRPRREVFALQSRLTSLSAIPGTGDTKHLIEILGQLVEDSGLGFYRELGDSIEPNERLRRSLELAQQRYDARPESERVLAPGNAIRALSRNLAQAVGVVYGSLDWSLRDSLPSLEPLVHLSPALGIVEKMVRSTVAGTKGLVERACQLNREILERLDQPDRAGLNETHHQFTRYGVMHALSVLEAAMGLASSLKRASEIGPSPLLQVSAERTRMLHHLWQGNASEAEACRQRAEMLQIQNGPSRAWGDAGGHVELLAHCLSDDLLAVKQMLGHIQDMAQRYPGLIPTLHYARGEYQRIRGNCASALEELRQALEQTAPGQYRGWGNIAGAYVKTLVALERYEEARAKGRELLQAAQEQGLGYACHYVAMPLALAEAELGETDNAVKICEAVIDGFKTLGTTGLNLGLAYETRARVAAAMNDADAFRTYAELCAGEYKIGSNRALSAKHAKLMQDARRGRLGLSGTPLASVGATEIDVAVTPGETTCMLGMAKGTGERAERALELLVKGSRSLGGFLYLWREEGAVLCAENGSRACPAGMDEVARECLLRETDRSRDVTVTCWEEASSWQSGRQWVFGGGDRYHPILLAHPTPEGFAITGLAVVLADPNRAFVFPSDVAVGVSRFLLDAGDVSLVYTAI